MNPGVVVVYTSVGRQAPSRIAYDTTTGESKLVAAVIEGFERTGRHKTLVAKWRFTELEDGWKWQEKE